VIGEVISRSVNRKRGRGLQAIGGASMVVSYVIYYLFVPWFSFFTIIGLALGILIAIIRLR